MASGATVFILLAIFLVPCRVWCRSVARKVAVGAHPSRAALTGRIIRAMSWRVGLVAFGIVVLVLGSAAGPADFATQSVAPAAIVCYPLILLSLWQMARCISKQVFRDMTYEQRPVNTAAVIESAIRATRYRLTVVEGVVAVWFLLSLAAIAIPNFVRARKSSPILPADAMGGEAAARRASDHEAGIIRGHNIAYTLQLPPNWVAQKGSGNLDTLSSFKYMFVGVVAEEAQVGTSDTVARAVREAIRNQSSDVYWSEPEALILDGRTWSQFVLKCKTEGVPATYLYYVYSGPEGTFQISGWTTQNLYERDWTTLRDVMQTFRFPTRLERNQANGDDARGLSNAPIPNGLQRNAVNRLGTQASQIRLPSGARISFSEPILFQDRAAFQSSLLRNLAGRGWPSSSVYSVNDNLYLVSQVPGGYGGTENAFAKYFNAHVPSARNVTLNNRTWMMTDLDDGYIEPLTNKKVLTESAVCYLYSDDKQTVLVVGVLDLTTKLGHHPKPLQDYSQEESVKYLLESAECLKTTQQFAVGFESL